MNLVSWNSTTVTTDIRPMSAIGDLERSLERESSVCLEPDRLWRRYLASLTQKLHFPQSQIRAVERIWGSLRSQIADLPVPRTQPTTQGAIQIAWYGNHRVAEVDVRQDGTIEWFSKDRITNVAQGSEDEPLHEVPAEFYPLLRATLT